MGHFHSVKCWCELHHVCIEIEWFTIRTEEVVLNTFSSSTAENVNENNNCRKKNFQTMNREIYFIRNECLVFL